MENVNQQMFLGCPISGKKVKHFLNMKIKSMVYVVKDV